MTYRSQPLSRTPRHAFNRRILIMALVLAMGAIAVQLINLTLLRGDRYSRQAADNLYRTGRLDAPRGNILDRDGHPLATNRRTWTLGYRPWGISEADARVVLDNLAQMTGHPTGVEREQILAARPRWTTHDFLTHGEPEVVLPVLERRAEFPGLREKQHFRREYLHPTSFAHVIGYLGKIQPHEQEHFTRPRYTLDDEVGRAGLERSFQDQLAPHPGRERVSHRLGEWELLEQARPGENLYLTLDAELQARAMQLLAGLTGTIILMDAQTGALLACASSPTFDPTNLTAPVDGREPAFLNLSVRGLYPAGSTFKVIPALAALEQGVSPTETVNCEGRYWLKGWQRPFHCNQRSGHGPVDMTRSLCVSCNVYYFEMAERLSPEPILEMAKLFGFTHVTGVDMPGERAGNLPALADINPGERTNLSIGQGTILVTPMQVARAYAALANGGMLPTPHVVAAIGHDPETARRPSLGATPTGASPRHLAIITQGLREVVASPTGTARRARFPEEWGVVGKTGTVERGGGMEDAWFAGFYPMEHPTHVVVVHVEDAEGHGGEVAAPIARDVVQAHRDRQNASTPSEFTPTP